MKLEEFISETINQIISGIRKTHEYAKEQGAIVNPKIKHKRISFATKETKIEARSPIHTIEFDVAITTTEGKETKGGIGVFVGPIGAGTQGKSDSSNSSISRIKFSVPVIFPTQDI